MFQAQNGFTEFIAAPSNNQFGNPSSQVNHVGNLLSGGVRPSREQNTQQFSNFGQCGKRNAQGLTGRIAAANDFREGDTDFGKLFCLLKLIFVLGHNFLQIPLLKTHLKIPLFIL